MFEPSGGAGCARDSTLRAAGVSVRRSPPLRSPTGIGLRKSTAYESCAIILELNSSAEPVAGRKLIDTLFVVPGLIVFFTFALFEVAVFMARNCSMS